MAQVKTLTLKLNTELTGEQTFVKVAKIVSDLGIKLSGFQTILTKAGTAEQAYNNTIKVTASDLDKLKEALDAVTTSLAKKKTAEKTLAGAKVTYDPLKEVKDSEIAAAKLLKDIEIAATKSIAEEIKRRTQLYTTGLTEAQAKQRSSIAQQIAIDREGNNSITALKVQQAEKERQLAIKTANELEQIRQKFINKEINWIQQSAQRNKVLASQATDLVGIDKSTQSKVKAIKDTEAAEAAAIVRRNTLFNESVRDQEAAMRHSVALQTATQINGINSVQVARVHAAEAQRQLERTRTTTVREVTAQVSTGGLSSAEGINRINAANARYAAGITESTRNLRELERTAASAAATHRNLFLRVGELIGAYQIWNTVVMGVKSALMSIPQAGIAQQQALSSIYAIFGTEEGNKNLQFLQDLSKSAGQYIGELQEAYRKFAPSAMLAGAKQSEVNQIFEDFTKVSTVLHFSTDQVKSLYLALEQMYAKTTVQSEEIKKQLGNVLPGAVEIGAKAWASYSKSADKSVYAFMEAMKKNLVATKEFAPAFAKEYEEIFGGKNDAIFLDASTKLLSNLQRVRSAYYNVSTDLYDITAETMNKVVKSASNALDKVQENLQGIVQGVEFLAIIIGTSLTASFIKLAASAKGLAVLTAIFNPVVLTVTAVGTGIALLAARSSDLEIKYGKFTHASKEQVDALMATYVAQGEGAQQALNELDRLSEKSNSFSIDFSGIQVEFSSLASSIWDTLTQALEVWKTTNLSAWNWIKEKAIEVYTIAFPSTLIKGLEIAKIIIEEYIKNSFVGTIWDRMSEGFTAFIAKIRGGAIAAQEESNAAYQKNAPPVFEGVGAGADNKPLGKVDKGAAAAAKKELLDLYKDLERELKLLKEQTDTALAGLDTAYADNLLSIREYYKKKEEEQRIYIDNQKNLYAMELKIALAYKDASKAEQIKDKVDVLNEQAKQISPVIEKAQSTDLKAFNNAVAQTNVQYLQLTGNTIAAAKAQEELNTAQQRKQLGAEIKAGGTTAPMAQKALDQLNANKENELLQANFDQAKKYRDALNSIQQAYVQMGATSSDVLTASLGGFSPLFNLFDNFQAKQAEQLISMRELQAEAELIANRKITEGDTEGAAKKAKDAEVNAKQVQLLDKQTAQNKIKTTREAFAIGESLLKEGSKAQKIAHVASMAFNVAEKFGLLSTLAVKGASAVLEQGKGDPYTAFARMAAMAALVASVISAVGGGSTSVSSSAAPVSTGTGTVLGDPTAESASLDNSLQLLQDINYKSYRELVKVNSNLTASSNFINQIATINAKGNLLKPPTTGGVELGTFDSKMGTAISEAIRNYMSIGLTNLLRKIPVIGQIGDAITKFLVKGLFGSVTRKITDSGIQTNQQQAYTLIAGMNLSISQYTTVEETFKSWFKKSTKTFDVLDTASKQAVSSFTSLYKSIGTAVLTLAEGLSKAAVDATYLYKFPAIKVSFQGKSSEKIVSTMKAVISKQLDLMATKVFGDVFGGLQQLGEGMFQTVNRIYAERVVAKKSFEDIGATFPKGIEEGVKLADALVQVSSNADTAAGKLKEFAQQQADFFKNFASTITQNNTVVSDFIGSLKDIFTIGLSIDQVNATKTYVNSISSSVVALNLAQRNYDTSLVKSKELIKAETAYNKKPNVANKAKLDKLEIPYQTKISETTAALAIATAQHNTAQQISIGNFETLQQVFIRTVKSTGSFSQAIIEMRKNLDVTTESGQKTYSMITQLDSAFTKLVDDVIKPITDQITTIADSIDTRTKETLLTQLAASRDYTTQKTLTTKIQKLITDKYNTEKTAITTIKNAFITLAQTVKDLLLGDLSTFNPFEKFQEAQKQYTDLLTLSKSNDVTIAADAASKLGSAAQKYLGEAKSYYGSTAIYADIFNQVVGTLTEMSTSSITQGTNATDMINALGAAAIVELQGLADTTTAAILATLEEGILALDITETTRNASDELATLASSAVNLGLTFEAMIVKFNTVMGTVPQGQTSNMQTLTANLATAIANKDKKGAAAIQAQITSYSKGFKKGGIPLGELYATNRTTLQTNAATIAADQLKLKDKTLSPAAKKVIQDEILALKASTANITKIGAFADGGMASGLSLVGERGPELIQLPNSTRVTSNTNTNRILADSNKETLNVLTDMKKELIILNNRMEVIERKTRLSKSTMSMA